jgi:indoleamine 2,3-dioxygenase
MQTGPLVTAMLPLRILKRFSSYGRTGDIKDPKIPQFLIGTDNGFLPRQEPLIKLPERFGELEELLKNMPKIKNDGNSGLLATEGLLVPASEKVPLYNVSDISDSATLTALFRDLTFWASAYLLEPCDFNFRRTKAYGLGRDKLPKNIAVPLVEVSKKIGAAPFMEYAQSYALYNWKRKDLSQGLDFPNLELIRAFENSPHESGFILVHVAMVAHSGKLVSNVLDVFEAVRTRSRAGFDKALDGLLAVMQEINLVMETMWNRSSAAAYNSFRAYIMGTKNQPMFPRGVIYEGVSNDPQFFRGESGANDTIIPTCDNLLQLTGKMPNNPLTEILMDFRKYRPVAHNEWLSFVDTQAQNLKVAEFAQTDANSAVKYLSAIDQVREFRDRHWRFTKEYILKYSDHPVATGGSPIITWLPNQLGAVLEAMVKVSNGIKRDELTPEMKDRFDKLAERATTQDRILKRELAELKAKYPKDHQ